MLIVSKFHDYYDTASIYGVDKTCVYLRHEKVIDKTPKHWSDTEGRWPSEEKFYVNKASGNYSYAILKFVIGFCGELYPVVNVYKTRPTGNDVISFYNLEDLRVFMDAEGIGKDSSYRYWSERNYDVSSDRAMSRFFDQNTWASLKKHFYEQHCPVFAYGRFYGNYSKTSLALNPKLKDFGFFKIKDPQTAFQDVYMYLSGVLGAPPKPKEIMSDKVLAAAKGHDGFYSFKKPPGKRGKKRWR